MAMFHIRQRPDSISNIFVECAIQLPATFSDTKKFVPLSIIKADLKHELLHLHFKRKENMLKKIRNFGQSKYWWKDTGRKI